MTPKKVSGNLSDVGALCLPQFGQSKFYLWVSFNHCIVSKYSSCQCLLVEKVCRGLDGGRRHIPMLLRIQCTRCHRELERRGHCEHESIVLRANHEESESNHLVVRRGNGSAPEDKFDESLMEDILETDELHEVDAHADKIDHYGSKLPIKFVTCVSDDEAMR